MNIQSKDSVPKTEYLLGTTLDNPYPEGSQSRADVLIDKAQEKIFKEANELTDLNNDNNNREDANMKSFVKAIKPPRLKLDHSSIGIQYSCSSYQDEYFSKQEPVSLKDKRLKLKMDREKHKETHKKTFKLKEKKSDQSIDMRKTENRSLCKIVSDVESENESSSIDDVFANPFRELDRESDLAIGQSTYDNYLTDLETLNLFEDAYCSSEHPKTSFPDNNSSSKNFCSDSNIDAWITSLKKRVPLSLSKVDDLCQQAKAVLSAESNLVPISSPVTVCGDIHGQYYDLLELFRIAGETPDVNYLFMGDYVDRGKFSVVVVSLLLSLKIRYPNRITLLRGNHESRQTTQVYGFYDECLALYGTVYAWTLFMSAFDYLPLCALIDESYICMHGGLSPFIGTLDQIRTLDRFQEIPHDGPICDIVWSDPEDSPEARGFRSSGRGAGCTWGVDVSHTFVHTNGLERITRAHQIANFGIDWCHEDKVVTVFSAPNYCYRSGNLAGFLQIDSSTTQAFTFEAAPRTQEQLNEGHSYSTLKNYFF